MNIKQHLQAAAPTNHTQTHSSTCCGGFVDEQGEKTRGIGWCAEDCSIISAMMQFNECFHLQQTIYNLSQHLKEFMSVYYCRDNLLYCSEMLCCLYLKRFVSQIFKENPNINQFIQTKPLVSSTDRWINSHIVQRALTLGLNFTHACNNFELKKWLVFHFTHIQ